MYRPKKHVRLTALPQAPDLTSVRSVFEEARKARGCTVELPWRNKRTQVNYSLTVRVELAGGDPVWTLYEGEIGSSRVVWSSSFEDVELLFDVLTLSLPEEVSSDLDFEIVESSYKQEVSPTRSAPSSDKPPGYYDSGFLKEEDLEFYQQREKFKADVLESKEKDSLNKPEPKKSRKSKKAKELSDQQRNDLKRDKEPTPAGAPGSEPVAQPYVDPSYVSGSGSGSGAYPQQYPHPGYVSGGYQYPHHGYPQPYPNPAYPPPPGYPQPYPPPGYPPQPGYGYPPQPYPQGHRAGGNDMAGTVAVQPGSAPPYANSGEGGMSNQVGDRPKQATKEQPNVRLGQFLVEAGIVPQSTVDAALQLQDLVRSGSLPTAKAAEAVRRAHVRGGQVDPQLTSINARDEAPSVVAPPLGQILVEAAILRGPILKTALTLQQKVRDSNIDKDEAIDQLCVEVFGVSAKKGSGDSETKESVKAVELLKSAGLLSDFDLDTASKVKDKHGGRLVSILQRAGKLDAVTVEAALQCVRLMKEDKLNVDKAAITLHYCQRSRVSLDDALEELGWKKEVLGS